jgi:hypothetical protein
MVQAWGALVLAWGALACGGVATSNRELREQEPEIGTAGRGNPPEVGEDDPGPASGGTTSIHPTPMRPESGGATYGGTGSSYGGFSVGGEPSQVPEDPLCTSPVTTQLAPFQPRVPEDLGVSTQLALARRALIGDWHGFVKSPWVEPYQIVLSFGESGDYSARCTTNSDFGATGDGGGCCRAFYYGSDRDSALKRWSLTSVNADNSIEGDLDIAFCYDECYLPGWQGKLRNVDYDQSGNRIRFQFWRDDGYGPLEVELERD